MYTIKHDRDHYAVYCDGVFYCSADTYGEALMDIAEKEQEGEDELYIVAECSNKGKVRANNTV